MVNCKVIAEAGVNHDGDIEKALHLVDIAADAGADYVKFQTFSTERLVLPDAPKAAYQQRGTSVAETQFEMLRRLELSEQAHRAVQARARSRGIGFLSTPFDEVAADFLSSLGVSLWKVPSGELTNLPFLRHVARMGGPMIISTGMATLGEVERALGVVRAAGCADITLLHCTSSYPAAVDDVNLRAMVTMSNAFGVPTGYSDHTSGIEVAIAAAALGAVIIEKHFTYDARATGPDHAASLEPRALGELVRSVRNVSRALGDGVKRPVPAEYDVAQAARKSLVVARAVEAGAMVTRDDVALRRPGTGLSAEWLDAVVGRRALRPLVAGTLLRLVDLS